MTKYRKKPIEVEAMQFDGTPECFDKIIEWGGDFTTILFVHTKPPTLEVKSETGSGTVEINDWVVKGYGGEFYPCKNVTFCNCFEPIK